MSSRKTRQPEVVAPPAELPTGESPPISSPRDSHGGVVNGSQGAVNGDGSQGWIASSSHISPDDTLQNILTSSELGSVDVDRINGENRDRVEDRGDRKGRKSTQNGDFDVKSKVVKTDSSGMNDRDSGVPKSMTSSEVPPQSSLSTPGCNDNERRDDDNRGNNAHLRPINVGRGGGGGGTERPRTSGSGSQKSIQGQTAGGRGAGDDGHLDRGALEEKEEISEGQEEASDTLGVLQMKKMRGRELFRHASRIIYIATQWIALVIGSDDINAAREFHKVAFADLEETQAKNDEELSKKSGLAFDKSFFKANTNKEFTLSAEVKEILNLNPKFRDEAQVRKAIRGLALLRSFAEYPSHMQEKLCKVAWYMTVEPRRVIIREGHTAECFYFVLSGVAAVKKLTLDGVSVDGDPVAKVVATIGRGATFGELALLENSRRSATVESMAHMQLLVVGRSDFIKIFLQQDGGSEGDHIQFLREVDGLKGWPVGMVLDHPQDCLFHFFKRGAVMVPDSKISEWLYIVKTGTCQVLKKLDSTTTSSASSSLTAIGFPGDKDQSFPQAGISAQVSLIQDGRNGARKQKIALPPALAKAKLALEKSRLELEEQNYAANFAMGDSDEDTEDEDTFRCTPQGQRGQMQNAETPLPTPGISQSRFTSFTKLCRKRTYRLPPIEISAQSGHKHIQSVLGKEGPGRPSVISHSTMGQERRSVEGFGRKQGAGSRGLQDGGGGGKRRGDGGKGEGGGEETVFVQVELLQAKDIFGLNSSEFLEDIDDASSSVTLISRGAEVIMLRKQFFIDNADSILKARLRMNARPYPQEKALKENLQTSEVWKSYKQNLIRDIKHENFRVRALGSKRF